MKIKEVIQGSIITLQELLWTNRHIDDFGKQDIRKEIEQLEQVLLESKSIKDIEREAFEAGRELLEGWQSKIDNVRKYDTFEDYLKSKE